MWIIKETQDYKIFKQKDDVVCEITNDKVKELNILNSGIDKIIGLDKCKDLEKLSCYSNYLQELDVSKCVNLQTLYCDDNELKALDISNCKNLQYLTCERNYIQTLDLSNNPNLKELNCYENYLQELDVSNNEKIQWLKYDKYTTELIDKKEQEQDLEMEM